MDKETLSNYGWIVICVLVLAVMIALAGPFGTFVAGAVKSTTAGLFGVNQNALGAAGITIPGQEFENDGGNGGAGGSGDAGDQGGTGDQGGSALPAVGTSAEDCTWDEIKAISNAGKGDEYFNLGDTKTFTTTDGIEIVMEIVAFSADTKADGTGTAGITWISKNTIEFRRMIPDGTNGTWETSEMRTWLQGDFYNTLPDDIKNAIIPVNKTYYVAMSDTKSCIDNVWIPSEREMFGNNSTRTSYETYGADYSAYYSTNNSRIRYDSNGKAVEWWLRTNYSALKNCFLQMSEQGSGSGSANGSYERYVVLGFCT